MTVKPSGRTVDNNIAWVECETRGNETAAGEKDDRRFSLRFRNRP